MLARLRRSEIRKSRRAAQNTRVSQRERIAVAKFPGTVQPGDKRWQALSWLLYAPPTVDINKWCLHEHQSGFGKINDRVESEDEEEGEEEE